MQVKRLQHIDAIRGVACLLVVFAHYSEQTTLLNNISLFSYLGLGQVGVVTFFMISGFVIPFSIKNEPGQSFNFITSRFFRLYPAYWISVILAVCSYYFYRNTPTDFGTIVANLTMLPGLFGKQNLYSIYWTLLVEVAFYTVCILLYFIGWLHDVRKMFFSSMLLLLLSLLFAFVRFYTGKGMPVGVIFAVSLMIFSYVLRKWLHDGQLEARKYALFWTASFVLLMPLISAMTYGKGNSEQNYIYYIVNYFLGIVIFVVLAYKCRIKSSLMLFMGTISYSVYLIHPFFVDMFSYVIGSGKEFKIWQFSIYVAFVLVASTISYFVVEKNSQNLGEKVKSYFSSRGNTAKVS
ncbi:acyltransferase [Cedecea sp. FDAARGOS_727]|uniref:acyltransferase family protein n=1 Tax=Cedecea sp. FDAARGOS_727 TaxID=2545798 RepID=UPI00143E1B1B|nr:acyltransferase [Cedecea sp. FDAARGOS_727]QIX98280.1 acyltransferase [Cedecea sp. FDAARGOS_727]